MLRFVSILALALAGSEAIMPGSAWSQQPPPPPPSPSQKDNPQEKPVLPARPSLVPGAATAAEAEELAAILVPVVPKLDPAELAGMAAGMKPATLSLEQAYSLTLIRAHTPAATIAVGPSGTFDTKALDEQAKRADAGDFDRFRREFLTSGFRDPAPGFLAALKQRHAVDSARDQVAQVNNMRRLCEELIRGEASGLSQLQVDQVDDYLQLSRQQLANEFTDYRSAVDQLKVSLGLPPSTPVVLDERILEPFRAAFSAIDAWQRNPKRSFAEMTAIHDRLPRLENLQFGGQSLVEVVEGNLPEEPFLLKCIEVARTHRPSPRDDQAAPADRNALELRIRRLVRGLILSHRNYEIERRRMTLALREAHQRFEQLIAPPAGGTQSLAQSANAAVQIPGLIQAQTRLYRGRTQIVSLWLQHKEQTLELHRELGVAPFDNWDAFHRSFLPEAGRPEPAAARPAGASD